MGALLWRVIGLLARLGGRLHVMPRQTVTIVDSFGASDLILDLGGGGAGVIGCLRGRQVVAVDLRKGELDEAPPGPLKVVADARSLPFPDASFEAATAFFFFMYVAPQDRAAVLREARRVLVPGGKLLVWDATIPACPDRAPRTFVVPIRARLPRRTIRTAYGCPWRGRALDAVAFADVAERAGFAVEARETAGATFHMRLIRSA